MRLLRKQRSCCENGFLHVKTLVLLWGLFMCVRWHYKAEIESIPSPKSLYFYTIKLPVFPLFYRLPNIFYSNSIEFVHPLPFHYFPHLLNFCSNSFPPILFSQKSRKLTSSYPDNVTPFFLCWIHSLAIGQIHLIHAVLSLILIGWGQSSALWCYKAS